MSLAEIQKDILLSLDCPILDRKVILYRKTWDNHIVPSHPAVQNKIRLIERIIREAGSKTCFYRKKDAPLKICFQTACVDFKPINEYLRLGLELKPNKKFAIITTVIPVSNQPGEGYEICQPMISR